MVFYTHYLNLENFPSVYSLCIIISLVFLSVVCCCCCCSILLAQIKRKNFQVSFSSSSCSLVGTVTRLIRSRLLRSRGPHTFCVVGRKTKQNGEKENLCVKERNAHISHWSWVMCLYALGRRRLFFNIIHPWRSLRFIFVIFSFLIFIYYSSMPQRSFLSLSPAVPSPLYCLDRIYLFLPITARQSISSLIYVDIVWIIARSATDTTNKRLEGFSQRNPWNDRPLADNCFIRWSSDGAAVVAEAYSTIVYIINATIHRIDSRQRLQVSLFGLSFIYLFFFSFPFVFILILRLYIIEIVYNVWRFHWLVFF